MKSYIAQELISEPGIQRDGTQFAAKNYINGQWCRFYMGRPRKMGGYQLIDRGNLEIIRDIFIVPKPNSVDTYLGRPSSVVYINFDLNGLGDVEIDRTPTDGSFVPNVDNVWDFELFTNTTVLDASNAYLVAQVAPNGGDVSNTTGGNIYYGDINSNDALAIINDPAGNPVQVSGGICFSSPVMIAYGNDGFMRWSAPGDITTWPDENNVVIGNTKILKMYRTRGSVPQVLAWTLTSLLNVTYTQVDTEFTFVANTIQDNITLISPDCVVEYNQQFFWIGIDQFYYFNGIVQRLENSMSSDWFFLNVNLQYRSKIWGMVIPRYKEIWWHYPRGTNTECSDVIIYNVELKIWYDSVIGRSAGVSSNIFPFPMMADTQLIRTPVHGGFTNSYGLWKHEFGADKVYGDNSLAIDSFFETHILTLFGGDPNNNRLMRIRRIEPDFNNEGGNSAMTVTINTRNFANSPVVPIGPIPFNNTIEKIDTVTSQGRLVSVVFDSNVSGGFYQAGKIILDYEVGDVNP